MAEGYVIVDLGMTVEEYIAAVSDGSFTGTEKQFNDIANAIKSGKTLLATGETSDGRVMLSASPYLLTDSQGEIITVGYLTAPSMLQGNVVSLLVYISAVTYNGHVTVIPLALAD